MTFLPIVDRELRIAARLTTTYRNRVFVAGIGTGVGMLMFAFGAFSISPAQTGRAMFWTLSYMTLAFCLLEGVRKTADCLSEEKREGTLGLLFLTDLKGYDVILGKLVAKSLRSFYGLFSILPVLALALLLGGTTGGEYWRMVLALTSILFFSLCVGMFLSCWYTDDGKAMTMTFVVVMVWIVVPMLLHVSAVRPFSPFFAFYASDARTYFLESGHYWQSLVIANGTSWLLLIAASFLVPYCWREEKLRGTRIFLPRRRIQNGSSQHKAQSNRLRQQMLSINPVFWLAGRRRTPALLFAVAVPAVMFAVIMAFRSSPNNLLALAAVCWALNFALKVRVAAQSCHCLAEARRNNALEMLLVTPLTAEQIIRGQTMALKRMFTVPIVCILSVEMICLLAAAAIQSVRDNDHGGTIIVTSIGMFVYLALFVLDMLAVTSAGMWYGLSSRSEGQAVTKTILIVLVAPVLCAALPCYGYPFAIGIPIMCMVNGAGNLRREFRKLAGQRYTAPTDVGWIPNSLTTSTAPTQTVHAQWR